ncbi:MAG: helix-turn-helix transcriptional regulator [Phyllobacteriaceae bacterium]|nr:helix-turn-helix transcriptional regulator [Phyllobacteriaceae bacterium]
MHIIPLRRAASDIFDSGSALIAVMGYGMEANAPSDQILRGLFDLSPAEAAIARGLSQGQSVQEIARTRAISITTARTHLAHVFSKTGTRHQAQLVALLKGISIDIDR